MISIEDAAEARISKKGKTYEILVDCEKAIKYKSGVITDINEVLVTNDIYSDAKKGLKHSEQDLEDAFGTVDALKIADDVTDA